MMATTTKSSHTHADLEKLISALEGRLDHLTAEVTRLQSELTECKACCESTADTSEFATRAQLKKVRAEIVKAARLRI